MQNTTGNQERTGFLLGQVAQAVGDYWMLLERYEEAREEYQEAITYYNQVQPYSSEFVPAQKNKTFLNQKIERMSSETGLIEKPPSQIITNLRQWLQQNFTEAAKAGWLTLESVLSDRQLALAYSFRKEGLLQERVKKINLTPDGKVIALLVVVAPQEAQKVLIRVQVHATGEEPYLPPSLILRLLSDSGEILQEVQSRSQDSYIKLKSFKLIGEVYFTIEIYLDQIQITEKFGLE
ncbi:DUF1822 family protein [Gloeothece verrucosa]|uniref:DUF1822 family protein n=1 Tax=Gloeothece verrucosa (strain PCC 7822) TaxID=497965 RepID=E0UNY5_GLOV7|nr:DUF1822 family protein [Gloeothece verrucosa]ADN18665.1 Protein of unknown function DUF1822 [Gloeothece verrucosa PCC 7822]